jgi:hypothetical protein
VERTDRRGATREWKRIINFKRKRINRGYENKELSS